MLRKIIHIDEEKCNGCGLCAEACHEGAIDIIDGKAKLVRENFCDGFGDCLPGCPTGAITMANDSVVTTLSKCMLCMACTAACSRGARILPPPMKEGMNQKLGALADVYRENEYYL
jgi:ferredoxin